MIKISFQKIFSSNQQLIQKGQENQKQFHHKEEKLLKELNENRTLNTNQLNDYKRRIEQLESEKEQLLHKEIVHVEPTSTSTTLNNEERDKLEQLNQENEQYKKKLDEIQVNSILALFLNEIFNYLDSISITRE